MSRIDGNAEGIIYCDRCGVEFCWAPVVQKIANKLCEYCCTDCMQGRPCSCGERMELESDRRSTSPYLE